MDLDLWISKVKAGQHLMEDELQLLCEYVKEILIEESNVQPVHSPVIVCGDIHGQFKDLIMLFQTGGHVLETNYIFMISWANITLLRGNHESRQLTKLFFRLLELRTTQENSKTVQKAISLIPLSPRLEALSSEKDKLLALKAGLRKVNILKNYVST
ncbi:hypothetical protein IFM89_020452 [Coptis chinensis]|uniref:Serine/threonine specific protein phosphatases domain-containing protein n=1 Tax=Coptis chinensis TaxID=261450 RepID=A0A835LMX5_9MAGN|nr:hypothetical protein IFM89_020452 [Coptis chinensis]